MTENAGHIQELAIAEVIDRDEIAGVIRPINHAVTRSLKISPSFGPIWYRDLDFGFPSIDDLMTPYANASGSFDETRYHRERSVSLSVTVLDDWFPEIGSDLWPQAWNSSSFWVRELGRWVAPSGRYKLYWRYSGTDRSTYWCNIRGAGMSSGIQMDQRDNRDVQMNWVCSDGKIYLFDQSYNPDHEPQPRATKDGRTRTVIALGGSSSPGITLPLTMPLDFPAGLPVNAGVSYNGTVSTGFTARIWAGASAATVDPVLKVTSPNGTEQIVKFSGLSIPSGQFIEIDTNKMTVLMNGIPGQRREHLLTAPLQFPQLQPGFNDILLTAPPPGSAGTDSYVEVLHYDAFLAG